MAGKGSAQRPTDMKKYRENWDRIFGKKIPEKSVDKSREKHNNE